MDVTPTDHLETTPAKKIWAEPTLVLVSVPLETLFNIGIGPDGLGRSTLS